MHSPSEGPNPYAPPTAPDFYAGTEVEYEHVLASRGRRLFGSILDGAVYAVGVVPAMFFIGPGDSPEAAIVAFVALVLVLVGIQAVLIATTGQSIAKKLLGMRIIRMDGSPVGFLRGVLVRSWLFAVVTQIPGIGGLIALVDSLFIFGAEQRCLHDMLADTKVVLVD